MAQTTSVLWSVDQGLDEKAKEQARQNIGAASEKLTEVVNNHTEKIEANTEKIEANTTEIGQIKVDVADIESSLLNKKDKQQLKSFKGSSKQTIKNISQTENGELSVEFEVIDFPDFKLPSDVVRDSNYVHIDGATEVPLKDGNTSVGVSTKYAREDHIHPTDTSREAIANKTTVILGTSNDKYPTDEAVAKFVNSSIATNTANYISNNGNPFTSVEQLNAYTGIVTNNDYAFVNGIDSDGNTYYDRYKATVKGSSVTWSLEYRLNNSSFTAAQWSAINSGITSALVAKIHDHSNKAVLDGITSDNVSNWNNKMDNQTVGGASEPVYLENGIAKVATDVATKTDLNNLTEVVNGHTTEIGQIKDDVAGIESALSNKKDKQTPKTFNGSATKTVKKVIQNANGEMNVEFEDIDLPSQVPNVEITSEDNSVKVTETTDTQTNTKKFDLSVDVDDRIPDPSTSDPLMDGTASVGLSSKYAREDHVHPSDTSKESVSNKTSVVMGTSNSKYPTDKAVADFVNSSIATNTANYISNNGEPFTSLEHLESYTGTVTNNDYAFVTGTDSAGNTYYDRYKATVSGSTVTWALEYRLNNSSFTAAQWAAINSGVTSDKANYWDGKQDALTFDGTYNGSNNKAATVSSITSRINNLDAAVTSTDGTNVQVKVTQTDGKVTEVNITKDDTASMASVRTLSNTVSNLTYQVQVNTGELESMKSSVQSKKIDIIQRSLYNNTGNTTVLDKRLIGNYYKEYAGNIGFTTTSSGNMSICAFNSNNQLIYKNQCVNFSGQPTGVTNFIPFTFKETDNERISYIGIKGSSNSNANITHLFYIGKTE